MGLSDPRIVYGIHSMCAYNRLTGLPYGIAKVLESSTFAMTGELTELFGGAAKFAWAIEEANVKAELQLKFKQIESWMFEVFVGKAATDVSTPSTNGAISALLNVKGVSAFKATTGIATATVKSGEEASLKFGKYVVKVASATTVNVYTKSDVDFNRGDDLAFQDDQLKITASALTIAMATGVEIPNTGIELTGGSGTIAMVVGDTFEFEVYPAYQKTSEVVIGGSTDTFPEFGALMVAKQRGNGEMFEIDAYRCKGAGLPLGMQESAFAQPDVKAQAFYDSTKNAVAKIRWVQPS